MQIARLNKYLSSVGIKGKLAERVKSIHDFYSNGLKIPVADIVVSEYLTDDGSRNYDSVWFFSPGYVMEAKRFTKDDDFDVGVLSKSVAYVQITKVDYDFVQANPKSRMALHAAFGPADYTITIKVSGENCDNLRDIAIKYIISNAVS